MEQHRANGAYTQGTTDLLEAACPQLLAAVRVDLPFTLWLVQEALQYSAVGGLSFVNTSSSSTVHYCLRQRFLIPRKA